MGPASGVFGRYVLTEGLLAEIDALLASIDAALIRTRKGRVWQLQMDGRPIDVHMKDTADALWDCEDDLFAVGLLPEDAPFVVYLSAGMNQAVDYKVLRNLGQRLAALIGGPATEPTK